MLSSTTLLLYVCLTPWSCCLQVLANVVAKLPQCEAIQLQRVSQ